MRTVDVDARRLVWCRGQAAWRVGGPITALLEDLRGALADGQEGLARHAARELGQNCAVVLNLVLFHARPLPPARMRAAWALERVAEHPLGADCLTLVRSPADLTAGRLAEIAERLVAEVRALAPVPPSLEGASPAGDWAALAELVGEEDSLPPEWPPADGR